MTSREGVRSAPAPFDRVRTVVALVLGELVPVLVLVAVVAASGAASREEAQAVARRLGLWVGPVAGFVTIFVVTAWAGRRAGRPVLQGVVVGVALALLDVSFIVASGEPFSWVFVASNLGRVFAGWLGGMVSSKMAGPDSAGVRS